MAKTIRLSKSRIIDGLQCSKKLYLTLNEPALADEISEGQQMIFDTGHLVGREAQKRFPEGVLISATHKEHELALRQTQEAIANGALAIFEATLEYDGVLVKIDILKRNSAKHAWEILEVKSNTSVKDVHVKDAAIQLWVARQAGLKVKSASVSVINNQCEFPNLEDLFTDHDITREAEDFLAELPDVLAELRKIAAKAQAPKMEIGPHCDDPYGCAFKTHCWSAAKVKAPSVFDIPNLRDDRKWAYYHEGRLFAFCLRFPLLAEKLEVSRGETLRLKS